MIDPVLVARRRARVQCRHAEHLPGPLGIARRDDRSIEVVEVAVLVEAVRGEGQRIADPGHGADGVRARPQMGDLAQTLERDSLLLQRIGLGIGESVHLDRRRLQLHSLALAWGLGQDAGDRDRAPDGEADDVALVVGQLAVGDDLQPGEAGAVVQLDEREAALRIAAGPDPAGDLDLGADLIALEDVLDQLPLHSPLLTEGSTVGDYSSTTVVPPTRIRAASRSLDASATSASICSVRRTRRTNPGVAVSIRSSSRVGPCGNEAVG